MCTSVRLYHSLLRSTALIGMVVLLWGSSLAHSWAALSSDDFDNLVGYAVIAKETIEAFTGCEHGKIIQFQSKRWVTCNDYGSQSKYHTDVVLFARGDMYQGQQHLSCKMVVGRAMYDVLCESYISAQVVKLLALHQHIKEKDLKAHLGKRLKLWEGAGLLSMKDPGE